MEGGLGFSGWLLLFHGHCNLSRDRLSIFSPLPASKSGAAPCWRPAPCSRAAPARAWQRWPRQQSGADAPACRSMNGGNALQPVIDTTSPVQRGGSCRTRTSAVLQVGGAEPPRRTCRQLQSPSAAHPPLEPGCRCRLSRLPAPPSTSGGQKHCSGLQRRLTLTWRWSKEHTCAHGCGADAAKW
jgi:hypothetical protein